MLSDFLTVHRDAILARSSARPAGRAYRRRGESERVEAVSRFLGQLADTLRREQDNPARSTGAAIARSATRHGAAMQRAGSTVAQVVHDYVAVCQAVTELSVERASPISTAEFVTLNRCLGDAIAHAVTAHSRQYAHTLSRRGTERLGVLAHELRNVLNSTILAFEVLKEGAVGVRGSTGTILGRNLIGLRDLIERSLADVRREAAVDRREHVALDEIVAEVAQGATIEAEALGVQLTVAPAERGTVVDVDRQLLAAALGNLLQNAFKFSRSGGHVVLRTDLPTGRARIEVEDECGGLPPGRAEDLFRPFERRGVDRSGLGLGLAIVRKTVKAHGGLIWARNLPGRGCIFTIDLPRYPAVPAISGPQARSSD